MPSADGSRPRGLRLAASIATILAVFVIVRLPLLTPEGIVRGWTSDSAVLGLMAKRIRDGTGFDVFFWGQSYLGPLTSALAAGIRRVFLDPAGVGSEGGALALRLAATGEMAFFAVASFLALTRLFGNAIGLVAGLWLAVGPAFLLRVGVVPTGAEMGPAVASLVLLLAARAMTSGHAGRCRESFVFGLVCGAGWWMNQTVVFVFAPVVLMLALRTRAGRRLRVLVRRRPRHGRAALLRAARGLIARPGIPLAAGFAAGYAPVWLGRLLGWYVPAYTFYTPVLPQPGFVSRLSGFVATDFWRVVGLGEVAGGPIRSAAAVLLALLLVRRIRRLREDGTPNASALLLAAGMVALGAWVFLLMPRTPGQLRYLAPVVPAALALLGSGLAEAAHLARGRVPVAFSRALAGALAVAGLAVVLRDTRRGIEAILREPDPRPLIRTIEDGGYTICHAEYWTAYKLQFLSDERVRFVPYQSLDRNRGESERLRRTPGPQCLVTRDGTVRAWGPEDAADEGGPARRREAAARPSTPASPGRGPSSLSP